MWWLVLALLSCSYIENFGTKLDVEQLEGLCEAASGVDIASLDLDQRIAQTVQGLDPEAAEGVRQVMQMLRTIPADTRRQAYQHMLTELGRPDFRCEPLEQVLFTVATGSADGAGQGGAADQ